MPLDLDFSSRHFYEGCPSPKLKEMHKLLLTSAIAMAFFFTQAQSEPSPWSLYVNGGGGYVAGGIQAPEGDLLTGRANGGVALSLGFGVERAFGSWRIGLGSRLMHTNTGVTVQYNRNVPSSRTFERENVLSTIDLAADPYTGICKR
jgi:hypothetical protein